MSLKTQQNFISSMRLCLLLLLTVAITALSPAAALASDDAPTVAYLSFGQSPIFELTKKGVMDVLEAYGYISADERATLQGGSDLRGENINILNRDAGFDLATASLMVEDALDQGADVLLTISTQVGLIANSAIAEMDDPPALIFAILTAPYLTGMAESSCVKPANVTGTQMDIDFSVFDQVRRAQNPDLQAFGFIHDPNDPSQESALMALTNYAQAYGLRFEVATIITAADYALAAESLIDKGVEAIVLPARTGSNSGVVSVVDAAYGVAVYSALVTDVFIGVPLGAGFQGWYSEGAIAGRMLANYLRGELDIATTAINLTPGFAVAVNLDSAAANGLTVTDETLAMADFVIEEGAAYGDIEIPGVNTFLEDMPLEERIAQDQAFLQTLHCTPEMIAEQQAALESGG